MLGRGRCCARGGAAPVSSGFLGDGVRPLCVSRWRLFADAPRRLRRRAGTRTLGLDSYVRGVRLFSPARRRETLGLVAAEVALPAARRLDGLAALAAGCGPRRPLRGAAADARASTVGALQTRGVPSRPASAALTAGWVMRRIPSTSQVKSMAVNLSPDDRVLGLEVVVDDVRRLAHRRKRVRSDQ